MTTLTFWFFYSQSELSAPTTEMVKKNLKKKIIKYIKRRTHLFMRQKEKNV